MKYLYLYFITTIIYLLYIQFSPSMGNIWIRNNSFAPMNAFYLMIHPFKHLYMWTYIDMWAINYLIWISIPFLFIQLDNWVVTQYHKFPGH